MIKRILTVALVLTFLSAGAALACEGNCPTKASFSGDHEQSTAAFIDKAAVNKKGNITDGSQAVASESTKGTVKGKEGIGATAGVGISHVSATNTKNKATSLALAGNISASGAIGSKTCVTLKGSGEASTVAVKGGGVASSNGSFEYAGRSRNLVVGGGLTAGGSSVTTSKNSVTSVAGHGTIVGVTASGN